MKFLRMEPHVRSRNNWVLMKRLTFSNTPRTRKKRRTSG
jgi:hypothetical protein